MAIDDLPRPWLLAALTGLRVAELLAPKEPVATAVRRPGPVLRREPRRGRLDADLGRERRVEVIAGRLN